MFPPAEKLLKQKPAYHTFRTFGCLSFPFTRPYNKHKLEFRSKPCVFLGYGTQHKGYKCLTPSRQLIISRHVLFDESKFPFKDSSFATPPITNLVSDSPKAMPSIPLVPKSIPTPVPSSAMPHSVSDQRSDLIPVSGIEIALPFEFAPSQPSLLDPVTPKAPVVPIVSTTPNAPQKPQGLHNEHGMTTRACETKTI